MLDRIRQEPAVARALLVAVIDLLVLVGVIPTGLSENVEAVLASVLILLAGLDVRRRVTPSVNVGTPSDVLLHSATEGSAEIDQ